MELTVKAIAQELQAHVIGDDTQCINDIKPLNQAHKTSLSFLSNTKYQHQLADTNAAAVLVTEQMQSACPVTAIIVPDPYLAFAKIAHHFDPKPANRPGIDPSAKIESSASVADTASIGANVVIQAEAVIGQNVVIHGNSVVGSRAVIGDQTTIYSNVTIYHDVKIGHDCFIHAGAVVGSDGFGNAPDGQGGWVKVPQIGGVEIGNHVEVGANTTIDRGTLDNTKIADYVKIDNLVQVAHNVEIGRGTALASGVGIAGSTKIGKNCLLGGKAGVVGHIEICDNVILAAGASRSTDIDQPGMYAGGFSAKPVMEWNKTVARIFRLDKLAQRVRVLEKNNK